MGLLTQLLWGQFNYFKDIYEWAYHYEIDDNSISKPLHAAHESGVAQEYLMTGYFEGYLKWNLDEKVVSKNVYTQLFSTLHDKTNDDIWDNSNETDRFNKYKLLLE